MNANETSSTRTRLHRIKVVSQIAKVMVGIVMCFNVGFSLLFARWTSPQLLTPHGALMLAYHVVTLVWFWQWFQLFREYERGQIFAAATIRHIKILGALWVMGWMLLTMAHFVTVPAPAPAITATATSQSPNGSHPVVVSHHTYRFGFFNFDFGTGIDLGGLLGGAVIVLIAWIMDEGRKIKEEQELTV